MNDKQGNDQKIKELGDVLNHDKFGTKHLTYCDDYRKFGSITKPTLI